MNVPGKGLLSFSGHRRCYRFKIIHVIFHFYRIKQPIVFLPPLLFEKNSINPKRGGERAGKCAFDCFIFQRGVRKRVFRVKFQPMCPENRIITIFVSVGFNKI